MSETRREPGSRRAAPSASPAPAAAPAQSIAAAPMTLMVVEDRDSLRRLLDRAFRDEGYRVEAFPAAEPAIERLARPGVAMVLTDLRLPGLSGLDVVRAARRARPPVPVLVMTAFGSIGSAVEAMREGAIDFLEKPVEVEDLYRRVQAVLRPAGSGPSSPAAETLVATGGPPIVGRHPKLLAALHLVERVAPSRSTVLLVGESGTGKELFARAVHALSGRTGPFVAVNCAAIPEGLVENELFGHEKGSFTGADRRQPGRFEAAQGGTLFLDEVGDLPLAAQAKVLRVLEERVFERLGGGAPTRADVRVVAATNRDLQDLVAAGRFRADLLYRLDVFPIELPPLRERRSDIGPLAAHLVGEWARREGRPAPRLAPDAVAWLEGQDWPGNVRELANLLARAAVLVAAEAWTADDLAPLRRPWRDGPAASAAAGEAATDERRALEEALERTGGDKRRAAELLGWSLRTVQRRVREYDLEGFPAYRDRPGGG